MKRRFVALLSSAALLGACGDSTGVPDLNSVSAETIAGGLTTASGQLLATGLFNQHRNSAIGNYIVFPETMARDALRMDKAEPRYLSEIIGSVQPDAGAFTGQGVFANFFVGIRAANTLIKAAKAADDASGYTAAGRAGLIGAAQTIKALNYWNVMEMRDSIGMPIELDQDINAAPAPWVCKKNVLAYVSDLLDSASTQLAAGGTAFQFKLPSGYPATPAAFIQFNRGIKAKVELYRALSRGTDATGNAAANLAAAVTALGQSFMSPASPMSLGVYQTYSTAPGETTNSLVDAALYMNDAVFDSLQAGDLRGAKLLRLAADNTIQVSGTTITSKTLYAATLTSPMAILKNEELLLLRAQVAIEQNDLATATTYMNYVRQTSGGLAAYSVFATQAAARNALLYEKRYSMLMEGPHRLLDLRAYSRLNGTSFVAGSKSSPFPGDVFTTALPIPINELNARGGSAPMTCQ